MKVPVAPAALKVTVRVPASERLTVPPAPSGMACACEVATVAVQLPVLRVPVKVRVLAGSDRSGSTQLKVLLAAFQVITTWLGSVPSMLSQSPPEEVEVVSDSVQVPDGAQVGALSEVEPHAAKATTPNRASIRFTWTPKQIVECSKRGN